MEQRTEQERKSCGASCRRKTWPRLLRAIHPLRRCDLREEAAEAERLAARDGVPPKTAAVVRSLMRRWSAFLEVHGGEYGFDVSIGPTVELAVTFETHGGYHMSG